MTDQVVWDDFSRFSAGRFNPRQHLQDRGSELLQPRIITAAGLDRRVVIGDDIRLWGVERTPDRPAIEQVELDAREVMQLVGQNHRTRGWAGVFYRSQVVA